MDYKLPIVTTNIGGIPDIVTNGENGFVNDPEDADSLAESLCKLLGDESLRQKMGEAGYKKFKAQFTEQCFENQMASSLRNCIGGG